MASASAMAEPRTLEEMQARYRAAQERNAAAARRLAEQKRAREKASTPKAHFSAPDLAALDAQIYTILDPEKRAREPKRIIARIAEEHGVSVGEILGPRRNQDVLVARHRAMGEVAKLRPDLSLLTLGRIFNRDHTTILHALRKINVRKVPAPKPEARDPASIIQSVAQEYGFTASDILGRYNGARILVARWAAIAAVAAEHPHLSTTALGGMFGRNRKMVMSALRQHGLRPEAPSSALPRSEERSR